MNYQSPGVYIEEVPSGPQPIASAPTSVVAIVGTTRRGPRMDPVRVTGWADFLRRFGGMVPGGYTAEAAYGYFENGGPAAYVVRVDPSIPTQWQVVDTASADSFVVSASSPGAWGNELSLVVTPDTSGGSGQMASTAVTADVTLAGAAPTIVAVDSTAGFAPGDAVVIANATTAGTTTDATVDAVGDTSLTLVKAGAGNLDVAEGDRVARRTDAAQAQLTLATGSGFKAGDLLVAEAGDRARVTGVVQTAEKSGAGVVLTLTADLASAVAGTQFTDRIAVFRGTIPGGGGANVALGQVTWTEDSSLAPVVGDLTADIRAVAANGTQAAWVPAASRFEFTAEPPAGEIQVPARLRAHRFTEAVDLTDPTEDLLSARFSYFPEGTRLHLNGAGGNVDLDMTAGTFVVASGSLTDTFDQAGFTLPADASSGVVVRCAHAPRVGDRALFGAALLEITEVSNPGGNIYVLGFADTDDISGGGDSFRLMSFAQTRVYPLRFSLAVQSGGGSLEEFPGLALSPDHPNYFARDGIINEVSEYITVEPRAGGAPITAVTTPASAQIAQAGVDVPASSAHFKEGLTALETEPEPAMLICPDSVTFDDPLLQADLVNAVVNHCEQFRRFAIVDTPDESDDQDLLAWRNATVASTYAAVYAPHLKIVNLDANANERFRMVPPSGFIAGVMARTDRERGVHKAPGNERVKGIVGLAENYSQRRQDLLNPGGVNLIRAFPGRGTRAWGARNATDDVTWRYVNVRRLFNAIENSVERGTQWVVFEPNTATTWLRIKTSVENFLNQLWRAGALAGSSPEQAYRVRVGLGETMTETDVDLGLVITEVAVAPAKPAEFVVFRFSHKRLTD